MPLLVPVDLQQPCLTAIEVAAAIAADSGEDVTLLYVTEGRPPLDCLGALYVAGAPILEVGAQLRVRVWQGDAVAGILQVSAQWRCRWVVMGTEGVAGAACDHSVARTLMERSPVPVLAVRGRVSAPSTVRIARSVGVVSGRPDGPAWSLGRLLARRSGGAALPYEAVAGSSLGIRPVTVGPPTPDLGILAYNPACEVAETCALKLQAGASPVILVTEGGCCCEVGEIPHRVVG